jgi:hypothetical protein
MAVAIAAATLGIAAPAQADTVVPDDQIVQGSQCVGAECVNGENFGFDSLRLKGPILRLGFLDTSSSAGFAGTDWELTANDADNVGTANFFGFKDVTAGTTPLRILAGAPSDTLGVGTDGTVRLGHGTLVQRLDPSTLENAVPADGPALVTGLAALPISTYELTADAANTRRIGPSAADFSAAFGIGDGTSVAPSDTAGVALAVAKELAARVDDLTGPQGPQGAAGAQGPAGPAGTAGAPGAGNDAALAAALAKLGKLEQTQKTLQKRNTTLTKQLKTLERKARR